MIKQKLFDNSVDSFLALEVRKQQPVFFPKEESQMFPSQNFDFLTPTEASMSDNQDADAFAQRATGSYIPLNSSHTATDYIGAINVSVPFAIQDNFCDFKFYDLTNDIVKNLYADTDTTQKVKMVLNGLQTLRIPANVFNTILTDATLIANNNGSTIKTNYGFYYITVSPKYIQSTISNIIDKSHISWEDMPGNNEENTGVPTHKRRTIYECDKTSFLNQPWLFENEPLQAGRLFGSVVEIWDSGGEELKQVKVMTEDIFNFSNSSAMQFVLSPDNMGYDTALQSITTGDIIRVFPRESYFNEIIIELNYKDQYTEVSNMVAFMTNDVARDMQTGAYQIYDNNGLSIDTTGVITGNVIQRYQISSTDRFELRKRLKM